MENIDLSIKDGVYTVLMTPFDDNYEIDYKSYDYLIEHQLNSEITGLVILGTTSESSTINDLEKFQLVKHVHDKCKERDIKLIIGIGGNDTAKCIEFGKLVDDYCHCFLVTVPNYNKPTQEGIYQHFKKIASDEVISKKPIMLYNVPSRTAVNIYPETVARLNKELKNIVAIKEASGSLVQSMKIKSLCDIKIFSGDDSLTVPISSIGGSGTISVIGNILPNEIMKLYNLCKENNYEDARELNYKLYNLMEVLFIETNPTPGKVILESLNIFKTSNVRLPLVKVSEENKEKVLDILTNVLIDQNREFIENGEKLLNN